MKTLTLNNLVHDFSQVDQVNHIANKKTVCTIYSIFYNGKLLTRVKTEKLKTYFINLFLCSYKGANVSFLHVIERTDKK